MGLLGSGAHGIVRIAQHVQTMEYVAVKITPTSVVRSSCKEITALARLSSPYIVQLLGVQESALARPKKMVGLIGAFGGWESEGRLGEEGAPSPCRRCGGSGRARADQRLVDRTGAVGGVLCAFPRTAIDSRLLLFLASRFIHGCRKVSELVAFGMLTSAAHAATQHARGGLCTLVSHTHARCWKLASHAVHRRSLLLRGTSSVRQMS